MACNGEYSRIVIHCFFLFHKSSAASIMSMLALTPGFVPSGPCYIFGPGKCNGKGHRFTVSLEITFIKEKARRDLRARGQVSHSDKPRETAIMSSKPVK